MSAPALESGAPVCPRCGCGYRAPRWGREYACGACGCPLQSARAAKAANRPRMRLPGWAPYVAVSGVLAVAVVGSGAFRAPERRLPFRAERRFPSTSPERRTVTLPPDFHSRLLTKLKYLREDFRLYPRDPSLPVALTECYLQLAVSQREKAPFESEQWARAAALASRGIHAMPAAAHIHAVLARWHELEWAEPGTGIIHSLFRVETAREMGPPMFAAFPTGIDPGLMMGAGNRSPSRPAGPPALGNRGQGERRSAGPGPPDASGMQAGPMSAPPAVGSYGTSPPIIMPPPGRASAMEPVEQARQIRRLSARLREHPEETRVALRLAGLLENEAAMLGQLALREGRSSGKSAARPDYLRALKIYQGLAARPAPRSQRVGMLMAAASVCARMENRREQVRLLRQAASLAPYESSVWYELHQAALRDGDLAESRQARAEAERWRFPDLLPG
jgi:hypothetical protein